ncbi:DegT/DnrJ/EryC1/StrS family aminotransferase [Virgibacillus pantothenticus]|uniref:DegT/DnrJ/EryC1/StrS aminotransferase family protein n=1 Tax=Virgibacillus pantothenticus TaxID=1473 RepID=UPI0009865399|nr:DegT/DnrJ/EryC1/StrS family aminotransferase [Virgibacillus pantothenticus]
MIFKINRWPSIETVGKFKWPKWPQWDSDTIESIRKVFQNERWAISGQYTGSTTFEQIFSDKFAEYNKSNYCITLDHGTSALISALEALDIGYGDEVIVPGLSWIAPSLAVLSVNATPIHVDIDPDTLCISSKHIKESINDNTKAIIPVHMYGRMANIDEILRISKQHSLFVIEDSAHSHGSEWNGKKAGSFGDVGVFSMQQGKVLTSGEGGAAITNDREIAERIKLSAWNSRIKKQGGVGIGDMELVPGNKRFSVNRCISEFQAAILLDQLKRLDIQNAIREKNADYLDQSLKQIPGIEVLKKHKQVNKQTYYGYVIKIKKEIFGMSAHELIPILRKKFSLGSFYIHEIYPPINKNQLYSRSSASHNHFSVGNLPELENANIAFEECIIFHHSLLLSDKWHINYIVEMFSEIFKGQRANSV